MCEGLCFNTHSQHYKPTPRLVTIAGVPLPRGKLIIYLVHHKSVKLCISDQSSEITYNVIGSPGPSYSLQERALSKTLPVIAVNRAGVVTSHGALGTASVDINSIEDHGIKQILPINIEVHSQLFNKLCLVFNNRAATCYQQTM